VPGPAGFTPPELAGPGGRTGRILSDFASVNSVDPAAVAEVAAGFTTGYAASGRERAGGQGVAVSADSSNDDESRTPAPQGMGYSLPPEPDPVHLSTRPGIGPLPAAQAVEYAGAGDLAPRRRLVDKLLGRQP
jgi:hypothetical protein